MKLSTSSKTSLKKLESYGLKFDDKLKELQELQAKVISNPEEFKLKHTDGTFKIVLDNIDLRITTRDMTSDRQNKDIHWVNHSAVKNRVTLGSRKRDQIELSKLDNRPRSIYQYSSMAPRLSGQNCKFFKFLLSLNSQRRLRYKENNTKYRNLT